MPDIKEKIHINLQEYSNSTPLEMQGIHEKYGKGQGVKVMVVDSGISLNHPTFEKQPIYVFNSLERNFDVEDNTGHGTHVVSIIVGKEIGLAPEIEYGVVKAMDVQGGTHLSIIDAISIGIQNNYDIITLSLGTYQELSMAFKNKLQQAHSKGITICCAVGNDSRNYATYPARYDTIIGVGGLDKNNESISLFSNTEYDILAPSIDIAGAYLNNGYVRMTGTSMATPIVVSLIAIIKSYCKRNGLAIKESKLKEYIAKERVAQKDFVSNIIQKIKLENS